MGPRNKNLTTVVKLSNLQLRPDPGSPPLWGPQDVLLSAWNCLNAATAQAEGGGSGAGSEEGMCQD